MLAHARVVQVPLRLRFRGVTAREAVLLRLQQELSLEEIGRITGVGLETVKSRLRYALDKLRARLNP